MKPFKFLRGYKEHDCDIPGYQFIGYSEIIGGPDLAEQRRYKLFRNLTTWTVVRASIIRANDPNWSAPVTPEY
jgi:hypothetical protein